MFALRQRATGWAAQRQAAGEGWKPLTLRRCCQVSRLGHTTSKCGFGLPLAWSWLRDQLCPRCKSLPLGCFAYSGPAA